MEAACAGRSSTYEGKDKCVKTSNSSSSGAYDGSLIYLLRIAECEKVSSLFLVRCIIPTGCPLKPGKSRSEYRGVIVLQLRPSTLKDRNFISSSHTGSFEHVDFSQDPLQYAPVSKQTMVSV